MCQSNIHMNAGPKVSQHNIEMVNVNYLLVVLMLWLTSVHIYLDKRSYCSSDELLFSTC